MGNTAQDIIGFIGGAQTLIEKFPMNILNGVKGKTYTSVIDFVLDILHALGVNDRIIIKKIIQKLFKVPKFDETSSDVMKQISEMDLESEFLNKIEDNIKVLISNILTAILSCSVSPCIPYKFMDKYKGEILDGGFMSVPLNLIDYSGMLNICPLDKLGKNYYNNHDDSLTVNTLYKSYDLNSFIWYSLNRGITIPQKEKNKMVWDNRYELLNSDTVKRESNYDWNEWLNSKTDSEDELKLPNDKNGELFPIMQLERDDYFNNEKRLKVYISSQTYYNEGKLNKTIYRFNSDYLKSIRILSSKSIITNIMQELLGGLFLSNPINYSINTTIIDAQINQIIKKAMESDDTEINDCYYSFSNDEYNEMLEQTMLMKYNAKALNSETNGAVQIDKDEILNALNNISNAATSHEKIETITKTIYDITAIPAKDGAIIESDKLGLTYNNSWLNELIKSIVRPIVRSIMSPQVMLLLVINMEVVGLLDTNKLNDNNYVMSLIINKIIAMVKSIIFIIKDMIVTYLLELFYEDIKPLINKYMAYLALEQMEDWLRLLILVKESLPRFDLNLIFGLKNKYGVNVIDDVNYADIYNSSNNIQNIPLKNSPC